ncbi:MAG: hypothetical protein KME45_16650 [Stenomitos rutilans HA7619-LM2]|jgi:hypothetical protein|nr:hypothetical protein [Stenomitos rutilans HA7619-LM2]
MSTALNRRLKGKLIGIKALEKALNLRTLLPVKHLLAKDGLLGFGSNPDRYDPSSEAVVDAMAFN